MDVVLKLLDFAYTLKGLPHLWVQTIFSWILPVLLIKNFNSLIHLEYILV